MAQQNEPLDLNYSPELFIQMMEFLYSKLGDATPFMRKYGGYVYFLPSQSALREYDRLIESQPDEAIKLARFIIKEGTDKYIEVTIANGYQHTALVGSTGNEIIFTFVTKDGGANTYEPVTVTYSIECDGRVQVVQEQYAPREEVHFNLDNYLLEGQNIITIQVRGNNSKVAATETVTFNYQELAIATDFNVARSYRDGDSMGFNVVARGVSDNNSGIVVEYYIDHGMPSAISDQIPINEALEGTNSKRISIAAERLPQSPGKHTIQLRARSKVGGVDRYSTAWYYEFVRTGLAGQIVTIARQLPDENLVTGFSINLACEKYVPESIVYGFYSSSQGQSYDVKWLLAPVGGGDSTSVGSTELGGDIAGTEGKEREIEFVPVETGSFRLTVLVNGVENTYYNTAVSSNTHGLEEAATTDLRVRLNATGRSNSEPEDERKVWKYKNVECIIEGVEYNEVTGWVRNALQLQGKDAKLTIPVRPNIDMDNDTDGCCVEVDYETFSCTDTNAIVGQCGKFINIKGDSATLALRDKLSITDRYPVGKRKKMAFNIHPRRMPETSGPNLPQVKLMEIINDGVSSQCVGYSDSDTTYSNEQITFGGTDKCGIRIYAVRVYAVSLNNKQELNNTIIDSSDIAKMVRDNDIYDGTNIDLVKLKNRIACLKLVGRGGTDNLNTIWNSQSKQLVHMDAEYTNPNAPETNWRCTDMRTRSHGQSTLRNPLKSIKIWLKNEGGQVTHNTQFFFPFTAEEPMADPRWSMKKRSMPQNKFVLQCYYIDSSNVKSPVMMQIMDEAMRGAGIYTEPMKYVYSKDSRGRSYYDDMQRLYPDNPEYWTFPYDIRYTPDSLPCILTTQDDPSKPEKLVGIFVLMDDKKSDFLYGERSIYSCPGDPFCWDHDKKNYDCLWDNSDTTRWEFLSNTHPLVTFQNIDRFFMPPQAFTPDDDEQDVTTDIEGGEGATGDTEAGYDFEQAEELIYPDIDDLKGKNKWPYNYIPNNLTNPALASNINDCHAGRAWLFHNWVYSCFLDYQSTGRYTKFQSEAADHMDLELWQCYYCFAMPNGAFDNLVRNLQNTTFHRNAKGFFVWLPLGWDFDILYGTINTGPYAFDPPVDRTTRNATYGIAFRGIDSFLWDALEAWDDFLSGCSKMMDRLNAAGYNYANVIARQKEFGSAWPKALYNESQNVKYKQMYLRDPASNARYLLYLLGDGESLREWWMKKNYDYWNARLAAGDFTKNGAGIRWEGDNMGDLRPTITVTYAEDTFFGWKNGDKVQQIPGYGLSRPVTKDEPVSFTPEEISNSVYTEVFSAPYIKTADYSMLAYIIGETRFGFFYDSVIGTSLQQLNIGVREADMLNGKTNGRPNVLVGLGSLTELATLNVQGYTSGESIDFKAQSKLTHLYAKGSAYSEIKLASSVRLAVAELPTTLNSINWEYVKFGRLTFHGVGSKCNETYAYPASLTKLSLIGMGEEDNIRTMVMAWLRAHSASDGLTLTLTGIAWDNMDYDDVILFAQVIPDMNSRTLRGKMRIVTVHGEERSLNSEEMSELVSLFNDSERGINVFSTSSSFQIDCTSGFILTGDAVILAGKSSQIVGAVFPLTAGGYTFRYTIARINGEIPPSNVTTVVNGWQQYNNFRLNVNTGLIETTETYHPSTRFLISCTASSVSNTLVGTFETMVKKRTYPTALTIVGEDRIQSNNQYDYLVQYTPPKDSEYGTRESYKWAFANLNPDVAEASILEQFAGKAVINIANFTDDATLSLNYEELYRDGVTRRAATFFIQLIYNAGEAILDSISNHEVFLLFLEFVQQNKDQYQLSNPSLITRLEARQFTFLPPSFSDDAKAKSVTHFTEISQFKSLTGAIDLSHTSLRDDVIDITPLTHLTTINLQNTYASIKF